MDRQANGEQLGLVERDKNSVAVIVDLKAAAGLKKNEQGSNQFRSWIETHTIGTEPHNSRMTYPQCSKPVTKQPTDSHGGVDARVLGSVSKSALAPCTEGGNVAATGSKP
jgi:hypothetical protein